MPNAAPRTIRGEPRIAGAYMPQRVTMLNECLTPDKLQELPLEIANETRPLPLCAVLDRAP